MIYDTIIIGRGPAGISCGVYLKRFNLNPLIIAYDDGALRDAHFIDNYYGINHLNGKDLALAGIKQAEDLGVEMLDAEVLSVEMLDHFYVKTTNGDFEANTLFLAMGKKRNHLSIKTANLFDGHGVSYCAICDGFFFKNKRIGLVGSGPFMESEYNVLKNFSKDITVFTEGEDVKIDAKIVKDKIEELKGNDKLSSVIAGNKEYLLDGLFIALGTQSGMSLAYHMGLALDSKGYIIVDDNKKTNLPHVYAGGDVIGGLLQVSKAVSDGAIAAVKIKDEIQQMKK